MTGDLFGDRALGDGAVVLRGFAGGAAAALTEAVARIAALAPFRHMAVPGGARMSVAMTNCGQVGWLSDRRGYRYDPIDPDSGNPWPAMPDLFHRLAVKAAAAGGYSGFAPDCCLINRYAPGARLSLHQDKDERDFGAPVVSVSLGLPATFLFGGHRRRDRPRRLTLECGDVVVWGGPARMAYHGVAPLADGGAPHHRINLTFRKAL
jgi:alkylated DNA repair protein (DNA oxidative demethylase)